MKVAFHISIRLAESSVIFSFLIVVLSNQGGISLKSDPKTVKSDQKRLSVFKAKATSVFAQLAIPISIYAATTRDIYRKPRPRMWDVMLDDHDLDVGEGPNLVHSVFVGDAGGRAKRIGFKEDHSSSDRCVCKYCSVHAVAEISVAILLRMWVSTSRPRKSTFLVKWPSLLFEHLIRAITLMQLQRIFLQPLTRLMPRLMSLRLLSVRPDQLIRTTHWMLYYSVEVLVQESRLSIGGT